jgi:transcription antitermination protein NusB
MASRRRAREYALQALFESDLRGVPVTAALNNLWAGMIDGEGLGDGRPPESEEVEFAQGLALGAEQRLAEIDSLIEESSTNWRLARMPLVDRNILRMAAYELMEHADIPGTVTINEAVELAKKFGTADSKAFVNGIVDRIARRLDRIPGKRDKAGS